MPVAKGSLKIYHSKKRRYELSFISVGLISSIKESSQQIYDIHNLNTGLMYV